MSYRVVQLALEIFLTGKGGLDGDIAEYAGGEDKMLGVDALYTAVVGLELDSVLLGRRMVLNIRGQRVMSDIETHDILVVLNPFAHVLSVEVARPIGRVFQERKVVCVYRGVCFD